MRIQGLARWQIARERANSAVRSGNGSEADSCDCVHAIPTPTIMSVTIRKWIESKIDAQTKRDAEIVAIWY